MGRRKNKNRKEWGLFATLIFILGFLNIPSILLTNFFLEPAGLTKTVNILFFQISPATLLLNALNILWGATIWHSLKHFVL